MELTLREQILAEASKLITGERNQTYGSPTQNFQDTAILWTVIIGHKLKDGAVIDPGEVAAFMIALKLARMKAQSKKDNWTDIVGYAGLGFEVDVETNKIKSESKVEYFREISGTSRKQPASETGWWAFYDGKATYFGNQTVRDDDFVIKYFDKKDFKFYSVKQAMDLYGPMELINDL